MVRRTLAIVAVFCFIGTSANALTMKECSVKYKAAQAANSLNGQTWKDFRKAECGTEASVTPAAAPTNTAPAGAAARKATATPSATPPKPMASPAMPPMGAGVIFPNTISPKYSNESAGRARMHTCLDQYNANKTNNGNGDLKWIVKGGGYYSQCNKHLKG
jgi:hypothetical protein